MLPIVGRGALTGCGLQKGAVVPVERAKVQGAREEARPAARGFLRVRCGCDYGVFWHGGTGKKDAVQTPSW